MGIKDVETIFCNYKEKDLFVCKFKFRVETLVKEKIGINELM